MNTLNDTYRHNNTYPKELLEAALFCGIPVGDIEYAYVGYAHSDEEVASYLMQHCVGYNGYYFNLKY